MTTLTENAGVTAAKKSASKGVAKREKDVGIPENADGVTFEKKDGNYVIGFKYNPVMVDAIRKVEGAKFDRDVGGWVVPVGDASTLLALKSVVESLRKEFVLAQMARADIDKLATDAAVLLQKENGSKETAKPRLSDYMTVPDGHTGTIVAINGRYAAQLTGFGKDDGAAFVSIHTLSELTEQVFKGDRVHVDYNEGGRKGIVKHVRTKAEREQEFSDNMGKNFDGVRVIEQDGKYLVEFDYNPAVSDLMQRIDGAEFDQTAKVWSVGTDKKSFLINKTNDMRREVVADRNDHAAMEAIANSKMDGAIVKDAFTKDGTAHTGEVLAKNGRYVLQHTGKEYFALHRASAFKLQPQIGSNIRIEYQKGKVNMADKTQSKGQSQGHER